MIYACEPKTRPKTSWSSSIWPSISCRTSKAQRSASKSAALKLHATIVSSSTYSLHARVRCVCPRDRLHALSLRIGEQSCCVSGKICPLTRLVPEVFAHFVETGFKAFLYGLNQVCAVHLLSRSYFDLRSNFSTKLALVMLSDNLLSPRHSPKDRHGHDCRHSTIDFEGSEVQIAFIAESNLGFRVHLSRSCTKNMAIFGSNGL